MCETMAILRFLAKKLTESGHEYYPETTELQWQCNSIMDGFSNLMNLSGPVVIAFTQGGKLTEDRSSDMDKAVIILAEALEKFLTMIETRMHKHGHKFVAGNSVTCADFCVFSLWSNWGLNEQCPIKTIVSKTFDAHTKIMDWQEEMNEMLNSYLMHRDPSPF